MDDFNEWQYCVGWDDLTSSQHLSHQPNLRIDGKTYGIECICYTLSDPMSSSDLLTTICIDRLVANVHTSSISMSNL